jgi:putative ABC transport system substrate-binding protein
MNRKIFCLPLCALLFALCLSAEAQEPKVSRIGFLVPGSSTTFSARIEALRQGLRDLGYVEGKDISIEYRYADGKLERLANLAFQLIHLKLDLIVAAGNEATAAAKNATKDPYCDDKQWRCGAARVRREPRAAWWKHHRANQHPR